MLHDFLIRQTQNTSKSKDTTNWDIDRLQKAKEPRYQSRKAKRGG